MSVPAGFLTCYCLGFRRRDPPSAFVGSDDPGSDDSGSDDSVFRHLWRFRRPTTLFLPFALYSWTLSLPLSQSLPNRLSINPNAPFHAAPMQPPWWNSVAIIGETSLTHRQVSRETTGETFHGTTWAVPQIVLRNNLSCSTNRSAKRSATIAQGSMPKSVEKTHGGVAQQPRHTRLSIQVTTHAVLCTPSHRPSPRSSRTSLHVLRKRATRAITHVTM